MSKVVTAVRMEKGTLEEVLSGTYEVFKGSEIYDIELHEDDVLFKIKKEQVDDSPTYEELMVFYEETSKELNKMRINLKTVSEDYNKLITNYENSNYQLKNLQTLIKSKDYVINQLKSELTSYKTKTTKSNESLNTGKVGLANTIEDSNEVESKLSVNDFMDELRAMLWIDAMKKEEFNL